MQTTDVYESIDKRLEHIILRSVGQSVSTSHELVDVKDQKKLYPVIWMKQPSFITKDIDFYFVKLAFVAMQYQNNMGLIESIPLNIQGNESDWLWILLLFKITPNKYPSHQYGKFITVVNELIPDASNYGFAGNILESEYKLLDFLGRVEVFVDELIVQLKTIIEHNNSNKNQVFQNS